MFRRNRFLYSLVIVLALAAFAALPAQAQKRRPRTVTNLPPFLQLSVSSTTVRACAGEPSSVQLVARATSQSGNPLRYKWASDGGRIVGDGANTTWDLSGLQPGVYRATLEVDSSVGNDDNCASFSSVAVLVTDCPSAQPLCPNVSVSCPSSVMADQPITFTANVSGGSAQADYNWTVTSGRIVEGQGTRSITVDTMGLAGQTITASLNVRVAGLDCPASCSVQIPLPKLDCRKFDEFPNIPRNDEKARLDNFAIDLQGAPGSTAYVVVYRGTGDRPGIAEQRATRIADYLVSYRGIDGSRIVKLMGPARDVLTVELWVCPPGVRPTGMLR